MNTGDLEQAIHAAAMAGEPCDARHAAAVIGAKEMRIEELRKEMDELRLRICLLTKELDSCRK